MIDITQTVPASSEEVISRLQALPAFASLDPSELQCLASAPIVPVPAGQIIARQGELLHQFGILLEGQIRSFDVTPKGEQTISIIEAGAIMGEVSLLSGQPIPITARTEADCLILAFTEEDFWAIMARCPTLRKTILEQMNLRMQGAQHRTIQQEKLAALGTLTAGLMHELNNPGAAASRAASQLRANLQRMHELGKAFSQEAHESKKDMKCVWALQERAFATERPQCMSSLEEADAEDALTNWLEDHNIADAWRLAPTLASIGISTWDLDCLKAEADQSQSELANVLNWLASMVSSMQLVGTVEESITRITGLVKAVKTYTYEGKGGHAIDLNESVHATLHLLKHKIIEKQIQVVKNFGAGIPALSVHASGINQIWTNLLDNAIDAAPTPGGVITVTTGQRENEIFITIGDNGAGIKTEDQARIFDTFYTTKPMGIGTGLGLGIAQRIATQAGGRITFTSEAGKTEFTVSFPVK